MIIWGSRGRVSTQKTGQFYCPDCRDYSGYNHQVVKRWFTFFFVPIFPYSTAGDYLECQHCKSTYNMRALEFDPKKEQEEFEAEFSIAAKRVMFKLALADGEIDESEIDQIRLSFSNIAKRQIAREDIEAELEAAKNDHRSTADYLRSVAGSLNESGKEIVLRSAIAVAMADGVLDESEARALHQLASALDMPKAYANGIFAEEKIPLI